MTLSSFLLRPAQTAIYTNVTSGVSVVTSSPAILYGYLATSVGTNTAYSLIISNASGTTNIINIPTTGANYTNDIFLPANGIDCPNGIGVSIVSGGTGTNIRFNLLYAIK
jgi:hypothetical protein